jgi:hypothetical protein
VLLRRSTRLWAVGMAIGLVAILIGVFGYGDTRVLWFIGLGTVGATLAFLGRETIPRRVAASIGPDGVRVGTRLVATRRRIRSAWFERSHEASVVRLDRGILPDIELEARDEAEAHTLLRALERDPSQSVVRFPSFSRAVIGVAAFSGQLMAHVFSRSGHLTWLGLLSAWGSGWLMAALLLLWRDETDIGSDGVLVSRPFRRRFIPFADIESATVEDVGKVVLRTRTHGTIVRRMKEPAARAAVEQIQSSMASLDEGDRGSESVRLQLRRDERDGDVRGWLTRLRSLANRGSYRAVGILGEALWRVMDDPGATGSERAAAAVVIGAVATPAERARLREAASRMASPQVRIVIQRVADPFEPRPSRAGAVTVPGAAMGPEAAVRAAAEARQTRIERARQAEQAEELALTLEALALAEAEAEEAEDAELAEAELGAELGEAAEPAAAGAAANENEPQL